MQAQLAPTNPAPARNRRHNEPWTPKETELVKRKWPDVAKLRRLLPHRSEFAIRWIAKRCGLIPDKVQHIWTSAEDKKARAWAASGMSRPQIAAKLGLTTHQVQCRLQYLRIQVPKQPPKPVPDPLANQIRRRAFEMKLTLRDLDLSLGHSKVFSQHCYSQTRASPQAIMKAVEALGGKLVIEWEALN